MIVVLMRWTGAVWRGAPSGQQSKVAWEKTGSRNEAGWVSKQDTNRAVSMARLSQVQGTGLLRSRLVSFLALWDHKNK